MKAFAAVATAARQVEYLQVEVPDPGPEDVVVRLTHSWISNGTEGSFVRGERIAGDTPRKSTDPMPFPHVPGYQKVGVVESVGKDVSGLTGGDMVFATVSRVCGMFYDHGGHVSPAVTHRSQVFKLPDGLDPESASGLVLTQVGYNVGTCGTIAPGDRAIVIGDGMVGHWTAQTLAHRGAAVMLLGRHDDRLSIFNCRSEDLCVNARTVDPLELAKKWAPGGVAFLADTVGSIETLELFLPAMRRNGHISSAGFYGNYGRIDIQKMRNSELTLSAPAGWTSERLKSTLGLLADNVLTTHHLITHRFPAEKAGEAFDLILSRSEPVLGVVLDWR